ncbi:helix-turn-helix domain-containing protein [Chitinophaga sp. SYP-B3965]|uniref:helix-turn-helix domain-containing protein n=1 Tax=Chitinophaga sp. SYP-B3965 TaxID=2663120 RepID=UPI0012997B0F|nr:helix-turn-helix domain-containing protein [Chitinophaga sp. SYP-B3965]MRG48418.1 helix-turn-helix domain-containing protein [Chitinophaga sp. SYP-B3965]
MHKVKIEHFYPKDPILRQCIEYYYFLKTDAADFISKYYVFPNTLQAFNIHKHATCQIEPFSTKVSGQPGDAHLIIAQGKHELPLYVELSGILDKITIVFKPLGLNHFIESPLSELTPHASQIITCWHNEQFLHSFFGAENNDERIAILEIFLLDLYKPIPFQEQLMQAVEYLMDFETERPVQEIITKSGLNTRSFNRLFLKNVGVSPVGFRKIARFRNSLRDKLFHEKFKTLTDISYRSNFYDQAYFIKIYRKLTGHNPSRFFEAIDKLADDRLIMKFIQE